MPARNKNIDFTALALAAILILAAAIRFLYLAQIQSDPLPGTTIKNEVFDQYRFMEPAKEFLKGNWLGSRIPGYSLAYAYLIAFLYSFLPRDTNTIFVFQILLGLLSVYVFYRAGSLLFKNKKIGLIAAFIAAFYSPFIFQECDIERGAIVAFANLSGFYFLLLALRKYKVRYFFLAGLMIGISTAMRGNALIPFIAAYLLFAVKKSFKPKMASIAVFLLAVTTVTAPLAIRNKIVGNTFLIETQGIDNFWVGNTPDSPGVGFWPLPSRSELTRECGNSFMKTLKIFTREIKKYPRAYLSLYGRKITMYFNGYEVPSNLNYDQFKENHSALRSGFLTFSVICPLALLGAALVRRKYSFAGLLYLFLCVLSVSNILFHIQGRYRIPAIPFFIIFASYALYWCINSFRKRRFRPLCGAAIAIVLLSFFTRPNDAIIRYSVGARVRAMDYSNAAIAYFDKAIEAETPEGRRQLLQKVAENFRKAIKVQPDYVNNYLSLGSAYYHLGQYSDAEETFSQALKLDPENAEAKDFLFKIGLKRIGLNE